MIKPKPEVVPQSDALSAAKFRSGYGQRAEPEPEKKGVAKQLLWKKYASSIRIVAITTPVSAPPLSKLAEEAKRSMRQTHRTGEKLFIDYAGPTVPVVCAATGEESHGTNLCGGVGRIQLHLRRGDLESEPARLVRQSCASL